MSDSLTPNMEMYLKTIFEIDTRGDTARVKTIAERLGVTMPSVSGAVDTLQKGGLVEHARYGAVQLTTRGRKVALEVKQRNELLYRFLLDVLQLPEATASRDACVLEHVVSPKTLGRLSAFLEFTQVCKLGASELIDHFSEWLECRNGEGECQGCEGDEEAGCSS